VTAASSTSFRLNTISDTQFSCESRHFPLNLATFKRRTTIRHQNSKYRLLKSFASDLPDFKSFTSQTLTYKAPTSKTNRVKKYKI